MTFVVAGGVALADQLPTRILVDGRPVAAAGAVPSLRNGQVWVPLFPVARELLDAVETDAATQTIRVLLSHNGETRSFVRTTGEIRREGAILAIVPGASDVVVSARPEDQQTPLDVLSLLLDVSVQVDGETGTIVIRREAPVAAAAPVFRRTTPFEVSRLGYAESMTRNDTSYGNLLSLSGEGQLYDGAFTTRVDLSGGTNQGNLNFLGGAARWTRSNGQAWTAGDMNLGAASRFLAGPARGVALDQPSGSGVVRFFGGGALSGVGLGLGSSGQRQYETSVGAVTWSNGALAHNSVGVGVGVGAVSFSGPTGSGSLLLHHLSWRGRKHFLLLDAALGQFGDDPRTNAKGGFDVGAEASEFVDLGRHQLTIRGAHYGDKVTTPSSPATCGGGIP